MDRQHYEALYRKWRIDIVPLAIYSKPTSRISLPSFRAMVACGRPIVPFLREKIRNADEIFLPIAVVEIMGWPWSDDRFPWGDLTTLRTRVLEELERLDGAR